MYIRSYAAPALPRAILSSDNEAPALTIDGTGTVSGTARAGSGSSTVAFPSMSATDNVTPPQSIAIACTAPLGASGAAVAVSSGVTSFPVGVTVVTCVAKDAAQKTSTSERFSVSVACETGFFFLWGSCKAIDQNNMCAANAGCDVNAVCVEQGTRMCICKDGWVGNGRVCVAGEWDY